MIQTRIHPNEAEAIRYAHIGRASTEVDVLASHSSAKPVKSSSDIVRKCIDGDYSAQDRELLAKCQFKTYLASIPTILPLGDLEGELG